MFGIAPVMAAVVVGEADDITGFAGRDHFATYKRHGPDRGVIRATQDPSVLPAWQPPDLQAVHMAAVTHIRQRHSQGPATTRTRSPRARPTRKHQGSSAT